MSSTQETSRPVPVRTIAATIGMVLLTLVAILLVQRLSRIIAYLVVAGFFAVVLTPAVDFLERRRLRRSLATLVVFFVGIGLVAGMLFVFIRPVVAQVNDFSAEFPSYVQDAKDGKGAVGRLVQRYNVDEFIAENQARLQQGLRNAGAPALQIVRTVANTIFAMVTIFVLAFLMVLQGPKLTESALNALAPARREHVRLVAGDCAKAVTGYMAGNLAISVIAGLATFTFLYVLGVPFSGVLGLWVAFADLIPMVGATLGAIPTVAVAFLASPTKGIMAIVFYVVYQQFENHYLQVTIMSRTVDLNPLVVLVSVLTGVELFGILGALLAIPIAGVLQVILRDVYDERRGILKKEPTIGQDEVPVTDVENTNRDDGADRAADSDQPDRDAPAPEAQPPRGQLAPAPVRVEAARAPVPEEATVAVERPRPGSA